MIKLCEDSMMSACCKLVELVKVKGGAHVNIYHGNSDRLAIGFQCYVCGERGK